MPAAPLPALDLKPAEAYRVAAVVVSRAELLERREQLRTEGVPHHRLLDEARRLAREQESRLQSLRHGYQHYVVDQLASVYADPRAAFDRLQEHVERGGGFQAAADLVQRSPEALGRLRGLGLGSLRSEGREQALGSALSIGYSLRSLAETHARWREQEPAAVAIAARVPAARQQDSRLSQLLDRLPDYRGVETELHRAAQTLGVAVQGLSATAVRQVARVASSLAFRIGRDMFLGRDDGLER